MKKVLIGLLVLGTVTTFAQVIETPEVISCGKINKIVSDQLSFKVLLKKAQSGSKDGPLRKWGKLSHEVRFTGSNHNDIFRKTELFKSQVLGVQITNEFICLSSKVVNSDPSSLKYEIVNELGHGLSIEEAFENLVRKL